MTDFLPIKHPSKMSDAAREDLIGRIRSSLEAEPNIKGGRIASALYSRENLRGHDAKFVRDLCRMLIELFDKTSAPALNTWKDLTQ